MRDVFDFAKFFIKNGVDSIPNTYDGNMKLQKMLVLANFANIVENGEPLFPDQILAFRNGCVIEKVRLRYKNDYFAFKKDSDAYEPEFSQAEYSTLNMILNIFGSATSRELSEINHAFNFWKTAYTNGTNSNGYHDKTKSVVDMNAETEDFERMREIISSYRDTAKNAMYSETINGVTFYYDNLVLTDEITDKLETFSLLADDKAYTVYLDNGKLVIY